MTGVAPGVGSLVRDHQVLQVTPVIPEFQRSLSFHLRIILFLDSKESLFMILVLPIFIYV